LISRTARISLVARDFGSVSDAVKEILKRHHGFAAELTINSEDASARTLNASLRTPEADFETTIADLKRLGRVTSESRSGEDVTEQSIDLDARLANARNREQVLTDLMKHRTAKLSDVLEVERQISQTRGEIEQMESQRKRLDQRIDYARIDLQITEVYRAALTGTDEGPGTKLRNSAVQGARNLAGSLVAAAVFLLEDGPVILLWSVVLAIPVWCGWRVWKRSRSS
jgi:hypothetical protein